MSETTWTLDQLLVLVTLLGILSTAVFSVFRLGRWFGGITAAIEHMSRSLTQLHITLNEHIDDENQKFADVESTLEKYGASIQAIREASLVGHHK